MGEETVANPSLSPYITIWLTLISGAILMTVAYSYWRQLCSWLRKSFQITFPDRVPFWWGSVGVFLVLTSLLLLVWVGCKITTTYITEPILKTQMFLALGAMWAIPTGKVLVALDKRTRPFKWLPLIPTTLVACTLALGVGYLMLKEFPPHLSKLWWMPCF